MKSVQMDLAVQLAKIWIDNKYNFEESLVTGTFFRSSVLALYRIILREDKSFIEFEKLELERKLKIWDEAKRLADGRIDKPKCVELAKSLYTLDFITQT